MTRAASPFAFALLSACALDESGLGHASGLSTVATPSESSGDPSDAGDDTAASSSAAAGTDSASGDSGGDTTSVPATTMPSDETGGSSSDDGVEASTTTGAVDPCSLDPAYSVAFESSVATLAGTMMLGMLGNGDPFVYSNEANTGSASFSFSTECADDYAVWAYVYDDDPLFDAPLEDTGAADRMRVSVDGGDTDWRYGCQTALAKWSWQAVGTNDIVCASDDLAVYSLGPGEHTVVFTPTEAGTVGENAPGTTAALVRIIVTNDLDFVP